MAARRICIVNFTGLRPNWGCQATSWELLKLVSSCLAPSAPAAISLVPMLPYCHCDDVQTARLPEIYAAFHAVADRTADHESALGMLEALCIERFGAWVEQVRQADVIVFQGEGTMSGLPHFGPGARLLLLPFVAKHAWGKPVVSLNQTIFARDGDLIAAAAAAFNSFELTAVREAASAALAADIGITDCAFIPDAAFLVRPCADDRLPKLAPDRKHFCVTGTALRERGAVERIFEAADTLRVELGLRPVIAVSRDAKLVQFAQDRWPADSYDIVPRDVLYPAVAHVLQQCEFVLGGRYHMAIMAAAVGTPPLLLRGNSFKNEGLAAMLGLPWPVRGIDEQDGIVADARELMANAPAIRDTLRRNVERIVEHIERARPVLAALLAGRPAPAYHCELTPAPVAPERIDYYADVVMSRSGKARPPATDENRFGDPVSAAEVMEALLAGLPGDPEGTRGAIRHMLAGEQVGGQALTPELQRRLVDNHCLPRPGLRDRLAGIFKRA